MSYFDQPPEFLGEMPLPEPIGDSDPGILALKANADHIHGFLLGGKSTTWSTMGLGPYVGNYGGGYRPAEYTSIGNLAFARGLIVVTGAPSFPVLLGSVPLDLAPKYTELGMGMGWGGPYRVDLQATGQFVLNQGTVASPSPLYVAFGAPYFIWCID